jgi:hypothetical protein
MDQLDGRVVVVCCCVSRDRVYQNREAQMQYLLLSAAVCRGIVCIKIGKPRCSTCCCLLLCVEGSLYQNREAQMQYFLLIHMKTVMAIVPPM